MKQDILPIPSLVVSDCFNSLRSVTFCYKSDPATVHVGFIAEDTPQPLATKDSRSVNMMEVVAILTGKVKQQQQQIEKLRQAFDNLANKSQIGKSQSSHDLKQLAAN